jgi:capsular exopolysaccharide synthesis family protein
MKNLERPELGRLPGRRPDEEFDFDEDATLAPLDLRRILAIIRRNLLFIGLVTAAVTALAVTFAKLRSHDYTATAVIRLRDARNQISGGLADQSADNGLGGTQVSPLLSLVELLSSRSMAGTVIDSLPLLRLDAEGIPLHYVTAAVVGGADHTDSLALRFGRDGVALDDGGTTQGVAYGQLIGNDSFKVAIAQEPREGRARIFLGTRDEAIKALLLSLDVRPRENTDVVDVHFTASDSVIAQQVANRLVRVFQSANAFSAQTESRARRQFLETQLKEATATLDSARNALASFRARQRAFSARDRFAAQQSQAGALQTRRAALNDQRQLYATLLSHLADSSSDHGDALLALLASPGLEDKPLITQIADQLARYQAARDSLTSGPYGSAATNPDVARLTTLIAGAEGRLRTAVQSSIAVLDQQIADLDVQRSRATPAYEQLSVNESDETALQSRLDVASRQVAELQDQYQSARLSEAVRIGQVEVVDMAGPPERAGISGAVLAVAGVMLGALLGLLLAFLRDYLRPTIWRQRDLATLLGSPNPVVVPKFDGKAMGTGKRPAARLVSARPRASLAMLREPSGATAEAVRAIRTKLLFSGDWTDIKTLAVTSSQEGEGKTTVAANLAASFAQQGIRTLLVDGDMRRPTLHRLFGVPREPGLSAVLSGDTTAVSAVVQTELDNLSLLPAGRVPTRPAESLGGPKLQEMLSRLAPSYDLIVVDSPPLLAVTDASIIAAAADGVLMIVRAGRAQRETLEHARQQLADVRARLVGAVLNDPDGEVARAGEQYYFYGYAESGGGKK